MQTGQEEIMEEANLKAKSLVDKQISHSLNNPPEGKYEYRIVWTDGTEKIIQTNSIPTYPPGSNIMIVRNLEDKDLILIVLNVRYIENLRFPEAPKDSKLITPDGRAANSASIITGN